MYVTWCISISFLSWYMELQILFLKFLETKNIVLQPK